MLETPLVNANEEEGNNQRLPTTLSRPGVPDEELDHFLRDIYDHFLAKGFINILLGRLFNLLVMIFLGALVVFLVDFVNYPYLKSVSAVAKLPQQLITQDSSDTPLTQDTFLVISWHVFSNWYTWLLIAVLAVCVSLQSFNTIVAIRRHWRTRKFYTTWLEIPQSRLETIKWAEVVDRLSKVPNLVHGESLSQLDIIMRLMRKENYLIALLNSRCMSGAGNDEDDDLELPQSSTLQRSNKRHKPTQTTTAINLSWWHGNQLVSQAVEWVLWHTIFSVNFGRKGILHLDMDTEQWAKQLTFRFILYGVFILLFSPVICIGLLLYFMLRYGQMIRDDPAALFGSRKWSPFARWRLRELNEVSHLFDQRLKQAYLPAKQYLDQFPPLSTLSVVAYPLMFMFGSVALVVLGLSFYSSSFSFELFGMSSVFYVTVATAAAGLCRTLRPSESQSFNPADSLRSVAKFTHYYPKNWRTHEHEATTVDEFSQLFDQKPLIWLREFMSVFILPYVCIHSLPQSSRDIVLFFKRFTDSQWRACLGHVCSAGGLVNFKQHGNSRYGSSMTVESTMRLRNGKMEKSFLNFYLNYPSWQVPEEGRMMLERLAMFQRAQQQANRFKRKNSRSAMVTSAAFTTFGEAGAAGGAEIEEPMGVLPEDSEVLTSQAPWMVTTDEEKSQQQEQQPPEGEMVRDARAFLAMSQTQEEFYLHQRRQKLNTSSSHVQTTNTQPSQQQPHQVGASTIVELSPKSIVVVSPPPLSSPQIQPMSTTSQQQQTETQKTTTTLRPQKGPLKTSGGGVKITLDGGNEEEDELDYSAALNSPDGLFNKDTPQTSATKQQQQQPPPSFSPL